MTVDPANPQRLAVALVWHMHQPYYRDDTADEFLLPWVRLRAAKDYAQMLDVLSRHPEARVTINMAPSLLEQLALYGTGDAIDYQRDICARDAATLDAGERAYLVEMALKGGFPRRVAEFTPLYDLCDSLAAVDPGSIDEATTRDLQVWLQLGWITPLEIRRHDGLRLLVAQGRGFRESDKPVVDRAQRDLLRSVIPTYRKLVTQGVVGPMTSPAFHPILPLLIDPMDARVAVPTMELPEPGWAWPQDADAQIAQGLRVFQEHAGVRPRGVWPPECAISPAAIEMLARHGYTWGVSDEGVLAASLGHTLREGGDLYRLHRTTAGFTMIFRDADISDRVGFVYANLETDAAVSDLVARLEAIADRQPANERWLVTIALDGENCWDFYPDNGIPFLETLYSRLTEHRRLQMVIADDFVAAHGNTAPVLHRVHSGSWIGANFTTWVGDPAHTRAWSLLIAARAALEAAGGPSKNPQAYRELLIAEGSDWFWWFGRGHDSGMDDAWDALFRSHLRNAYVAMGAPVPPAVDTALLETGLAARIAPLRSIDPELHGDTEWQCAGRIDLHLGMGAMHPPHAGLDAIEYGAGSNHLHVRLRGGRGAVDAALIVERQGMRQRVAFGVNGVVHHTLAAGHAVFHVEVGYAGARHLVTPNGGVAVDVPASATPRRCIAIVAAEMAPLARGGEVGDLVAAMAERITAAGHDVVVIVPGHQGLLLGGAGVRIPHIDVPGTEAHCVARILQRTEGSAAVLVVDIPGEFSDRPIYDNLLDAVRYVGFARCAVDVLTALDLNPTTVICLEWQTAIAAALVRQRGGHSVFARLEPCVRHEVAAGLVAAVGVDPGGAWSVELTELGERRASAVAEGRALAAEPVGFLDEALSSVI